MRASHLLLGMVVAGVLVSVHFHQQRQARQHVLEAARAHASSTLSASHFEAVPVQSTTPRAPFVFKGYQVQPLADFSLRARVLSREDYSFDAGARLAPVDLALGWQRMAEPAIYEALDIRQGGRWYRYSWSDAPPIPVREIVENSANMHMIPANDDVARLLDAVQPGDMLRLRGLLVAVSGDDGWHWRSSLSRSDSGAGACELIYVEALAIEVPGA